MINFFLPRAHAMCTSLRISKKVLKKQFFHRDNKRKSFFFFKRQKWSLYCIRTELSTSCFDNKWQCRIASTGPNFSPGSFFFHLACFQFFLFLIILITQQKDFHSILLLLRGEAHHCWQGFKAYFSVNIIQAIAGLMQFFLQYNIYEDACRRGWAVGQCEASFRGNLIICPWGNKLAEIPHNKRRKLRVREAGFFARKLKAWGAGLS